MRLPLATRQLPDRRATRLRRVSSEARPVEQNGTKRPGTYVRFDRLAGTFVVVLTNRVFPDDTASDYPMRRKIFRVVLDTDPIYKDVLKPARNATPSAINH